MTTATLAWENTFCEAYSSEIQSIVITAGGKVGSVQEDMVLEKLLRALHLHLQDPCKIL